MQNNHLYEFGPFCLQPCERLLLHNGEPVPLPPKAFDTLLVLVKRSGHLVEKEELMQAVWPETAVEEGNLNLAISQIRKALRDKSTKPQYIQTIPKHGYRFVAEVKEVCQENPISPSTENRSGIANIAEEAQRITAAAVRISKQKRVQNWLLITALAVGAFIFLFATLGPVTWKRAVAIRSPAPQIDNAVNLSPPFAGQQFYIRINGQGIDPKNARVVVTGKGCQEFGPCNVPNEILHWYGNVTDSQIERVPMTLAPGDFQVFVQNGPKGEASNSVPLTVTIEEKE